jgi:hypothetical protein
LTFFDKLKFNSSILNIFYIELIIWLFNIIILIKLCESYSKRKQTFKVYFLYFNIGMNLVIAILLLILKASKIYFFKVDHVGMISDDLLFSIIPILTVTIYTSYLHGQWSDFQNDDWAQKSIDYVLNMYLLILINLSKITLNALKTKNVILKDFKEFEFILTFLTILLTIRLYFKINNYLK